MNIKRIKECIVKRLDYCKAVANDIIKYNATNDIIAYAKKWVEIESPMTKETDACWVRINWSDIWIFIHMDENTWHNDNTVKFTGKVNYQLDPFAGYGGEIIDVNSIDAFMEELRNLDLEENELVKNEYNGDFNEEDWGNATPQKMYIPYCEAL